MHSINSVKQGILPKELHQWNEGCECQLQKWSLGSSSHLQAGKYTPSHPPENPTNQLISCWQMWDFWDGLETRNEIILRIIRQQVLAETGNTS